eukprot:gnl/TRDRNA2_/TRDRNA2_86637_c1_seq1.p1 gnl/TRDRNA2_/TRDRNA2_86637_c1~~gnl/TRDRNA2_/TRDRNA2_86637_c1_seq1.p1  ORF type:complete len:216 (+),score=61.62 gnl/TRDRNA2_/TRDRNA2_86637_c1_seq1:45-650(+)
MGFAQPGMPMGKGWAPPSWGVPPPMVDFYEGDLSYGMGWDSTPWNKGKGKGKENLKGKAMGKETPVFDMSASPEMQQQMMGEHLYGLVQPLAGSTYLAQKITGMLLELPQHELAGILLDPSELSQRVNEARQVLKDDGLLLAEGPAPPPGSAASRPPPPPPPPVTASANTYWGGGATNGWGGPSSWGKGSDNSWSQWNSGW